MATKNSANSSLMKIRSSNSTFEFEVNYSKSKDLPIGEYISSLTFTAGGYDWALHYFPQGEDPGNKGSHVSLFLVLKSEARDIDAEFSFELFEKGEILVTLYSAIKRFAEQGDCWGPVRFISRNKIEELYCMNDILVISCDIKVLSEYGAVKNYPGGLCEHTEKFWEKGERFDVTFEVEGENISAHRFMLALRSPVFEATLFGSMADAKMEHIKIDEMKAKVFKTLLHFIYTDQLPIAEAESSDGEKDNETCPVELLHDLFRAADRYALDKLTLLCEKKLEMNLSVDSVCTTLVLADQHNRNSLKEKCLDFASAPENFSLVALTEGYLQIIQGSPALFAELSEKVKTSPPFANKFAKKQKTN